jgi:hypothetical protein
MLSFPSVHPSPSGCPQQELVGFLDCSRIIFLSRGLLEQHIFITDTYLKFKIQYSINDEKITSNGNERIYFGSI